MKGQGRVIKLALSARFVTEFNLLYDFILGKHTNKKKPLTQTMADWQPHFGAREGLEPLGSDLEG